MKLDTYSSKVLKESKTLLRVRAAVRRDSSSVSDLNSLPASTPQLSLEQSCMLRFWLPLTRWHYTCLKTITSSNDWSQRSKSGSRGLLAQEDYLCTLWCLNTSTLLTFTIRLEAHLCDSMKIRLVYSFKAVTKCRRPQWTVSHEAITMYSGYSECSRQLGLAVIWSGQRKRLLSGERQTEGKRRQSENIMRLKRPISSKLCVCITVRM